MRSFIRFRTAEGVFLAPIDRVVGVRAVAEVRPLPGRRRGVAGLIEQGGDVLTVLSPLGDSGSHVLLLSSDHGAFGLLVTEVLGLATLSEEDLGPAPMGQAKAFVAGTVKAQVGIELLLEVDGLWRELAGKETKG
jgi:chemotaxis signal transduction protein